MTVISNITSHEYNRIVLNWVFIYVIFRVLLFLELRISGHRLVDSSYSVSLPILVEDSYNEKTINNLILLFNKKQQTIRFVVSMLQ